MFSISSCVLCSQTSLFTPRSLSTIFFSYMRMVSYTNWYTDKISYTYPLVIIAKIIKDTGLRDRCINKNPSSEPIKNNLLSLIKATYTPLPPSTYRGRSHKNIFRNSCPVSADSLIPLMDSLGLPGIRVRESHQISGSGVLALTPDRSHFRRWQNQGFLGLTGSPS